MFRRNDKNFDTPGAQRRAADCLRFASPAEATGGLELGGLELGGLEEACKRLERGLEYLVVVVLGAQIS